MSVLTSVASLLSGLFQRLMWWFLVKSRLGWRNELSRFDRGENRWSRAIQNRNMYVILCVLMSLGLFPYLATEAFADSALLGLSFIWAALLAFCFGYILRHPATLIIVFMGVIFAREPFNVLVAAKKEASVGNIIGAVILLALSAYLMVYANSMKTGAILMEQPPQSSYHAGRPRNQRRRDRRARPR